METEKHRTTVSIDKDVFIKIKILAVKKNITIADLANEAFKMLLKKEENKEGEKN